MTRDPAHAIGRALELTTGFNGLCLRHVRTAYDVPPRYQSAIVAWTKATTKHPTSDVRKIPVGAPIFFSHPKSTYGHVAIYLGRGLMCTTNSAVGHPVTQKVSLWTTGYGYTLLGWTEDLNGCRIHGLHRPQASPGRSRSTLAITGRLDRATITRLQKTLGTPVDGTIDGLRTDGGRVVSNGDSALVRALQRKFGSPCDGHISGPRSALVSAMQRSYGMPEVDGCISAGYSSLVAELQRRLNDGSF